MVETVMTDSGRWAPARPMLARVADAMYWMSRYVERAEHVARLVNETTTVLTDVGEVEPEFRVEHWRGVLRVVAADAEPGAAEILAGEADQVELRTARYLTFDPACRNSLISCVSAARENARSVREAISSEMWETLNALYWLLRGDEGRAMYVESPQELWRAVGRECLLFQGATDQMLAHGQGWLFTQLGKQLERIDMTCRLIAVKGALLERGDLDIDAAERNIHWMSVLKISASLEAYRRIHAGDLDRQSVIAFLLLEPTFPQCVRACVARAYDAATRIREAIGRHGTDAVERILGRLDTQMEYAEAGEVFRTGVDEYLRQMQQAVAAGADALRTLYFLY